MRSFGPRPRGDSSGPEAVPWRPGLASEGRRRLLAVKAKTSRTQHSCGLRRSRSAEQGGCAGVSAPAGPDTQAFPAPWPCECGRLTPRRECPVRPGSRSGRVVRRLLLILGAALRWGSGGLGEGASAPSPFSWDSFALSPFNPPTHLRGAAGTAARLRRKRARPASHQTGGLPGLRPRTPEADWWSSDNGLSALRLAPKAPVRRRRAGRAVAQCLMKRLTSNTSLVCSMW